MNDLTGRTASDVRRAFRLRAATATVAVAIASAGIVANAASGTADIDRRAFQSPDGVEVILGGSAGPGRASIWIDGARTDFTTAALDGLFAEADGTIWANGASGITNRATLWRSGPDDVFTTSRIPGSGGVVHGLWVEDGVPLHFGTSGFFDEATYWIGDEPFNIGAQNAVLRGGMGIDSDGEIVVAGNRGSIDRAAVFRDGEWRLIREEEAKIRGISEENDIVYLCGEYGLSGLPGVWVDEVLQEFITPDAVLEHIFVDDGAIVVAGIYGPQSVAAYWVDGVRTDLTDDAVFINDLIVSDGVVYLVGHYGVTGQPAFWVDGVRVDLENSRAEAHLIAVRPR